MRERVEGETGGTRGDNGGQGGGRDKAGLRGLWFTQAGVETMGWAAREGGKKMVKHISVAYFSTRISCIKIGKGWDFFVLGCSVLIDS